VPWITPTSPAGGQGDGTVDYVVAANPTADVRRGTVAIGGQVVELTQEGLTCQFTLQPTSQRLEAGGGNGSFTVEGPIGCNWTPTTADDWITISDGGSRSANGSVNFSIAPNTGAVRDGSIDVGGQTFAIQQGGPACRFQLSPTTKSFGGAGGTDTVTVTVIGARSCAWTASTNVPWISVVGAASGTGNATVSFAVQGNPGAARNGILTIGGQRYTVTQQQAACSYTITPASASFPAGGGQDTLTVSAGSPCTWNTSDVPPWVTGVPANGTGRQSFTFTVEPNPGAARSAAIIIGGQSFAVSQASGCTYSLAPASHNPTSAGGASSVAVNTAAGCDWTSSGVPSWITGVPATGAGPQTINFVVAANTASAARTASIVIGGQTFAVSQAGACSYSLKPDTYNPAAGGGSSSVAVSTAAGCAWTTSGVPAWITGVPANGSGPQSINIVVAANTGIARNASIVIGGQTFTVAQASGCSYSLTPDGYNPPVGGGSSSVAVNTAAGCAWTTSGVPAWITGIPASGSGPQTINFTVSANTGAGRTANVTIGGRFFVVTQPAATPCNYSLSTGSYNAAAGGGSSSVNVSTASGCAWTSSGVPSWITGIPATGTGSTTINFTVASNPSSAPRSANITIAGRTFAVTQPGAACIYSLSANSYSAPAGGGSSTLSVNTPEGCNWTASGVPSWVKGIPANGTGPTTFNFTVAANTSRTSRNANITIAGRPFTVTQAGAP
jgi:hypothetical protein